MVHKYLDQVSRGQTEDEMAHGLPVIIYARWVLVVAGIVFALWNASNLVELEVAVVLILGLAVANFFLHVEMAKKRTVNRMIVYGMSAADLVAITGVIFATGEFGVSTYVFYLPALLAISVTFRTVETAVYTGATAIVYGIFAAIADVSDSLAVDDGRGAAVIAHLVVLVAVPFCGNVYWRIERTRREREGELQTVRQDIAVTSGRDGVVSQEQTPIEVRNA